MSPLVSIITPTYNRESYIGLAIDSVLGQTYDNWELIIIDDGSTDSTANIVMPYCTDPRIKYFSQPNYGQAVARNKGIQIAKGQFICFMDSDNMWMETKLEEQIVLFAQHPDIDVIYADTETIDENGQLLTTANMRRHSGLIYDQLLKDNCVSFNTSMTKCQAIQAVGGLDDSVRRGDDYDLWLRLSARSRFLYVPKYWAKYRVMRDQISSDKDGRFASNLESINRFFAANPTLATRQRKKQTFCHFHARRARSRLASNRFREAFRDVISAISIAPLRPDGWRVLLRWVLSGLRTRKTGHDQT